MAEYIEREAVYKALLEAYPLLQTRYLIDVLEAIPTADVVERKSGELMYDELIADLREEAEWAEANEWEAPIMLSDHLKQAANAIEERCQQVDKFAEEAARLYEKQPKWIPVTERLPEKYVGDWLCYTKEGEILILPYDTPGCGIKDCVFYELDNDGYLFKTYSVTHWMELPEPPKEE